MYALLADISWLFQHVTGETKLITTNESLEMKKKMFRCKFTSHVCKFTLSEALNLLFDLRNGSAREGSSAGLEIQTRVTEWRQSGRVVSVLDS